MKVVVFDVNVVKYIRIFLFGKIFKKFFYNRFLCILLKDIFELQFFLENYVKIKIIYVGICGFDLNFIFLYDLFLILFFVLFFFVIGYENFGVIVEKGKVVFEFEIGDRVIVDLVFDCDV